MLVYTEERVVGQLFLVPMESLCVHLGRHTFILAGAPAEALWRQVQDLLSDPQLEVRNLLTGSYEGV